MHFLRNDLPDLADEILERSRVDRPLKEALNDYGQACSSEEDPGLSPETRRCWAEIRNELVRELERRVRRQMKPDPEGRNTR